MNVVLRGTGSYVPDNIVTNEDLAKIVDTTDEWIRTRTGIEARRISKKENTSDLAYMAAQRALEHVGVGSEKVELIICATMSPDSFMPSTACIVQEKLGAVNAAAFDLSAACTGFIYAIAVATQFIKTGMYKNALVIGAETLSKLLDWEDRSTCVLFGDGAGAVYLENSDDKDHIKCISLHADGRKKDLLVCSALPMEGTENNTEPSHTITMQGGEVFKFAVKTIVDNINEILNQAALRIQDIKWIIPHQANIRIIEHAAKLLEVSTDKFYVNVQDYGNTSAASIGIALDELVKANELKEGDKVILIGFGGGMTSGAILLEW